MARCGNCKSEFCGNDTRCDSSLYGSGGVELCEHCSSLEETAINEAGTNDIESRLNHYLL